MGYCIAAWTSNFPLFSSTLQLTFGFHNSQVLIMNAFYYNDTDLVQSSLCSVYILSILLIGIGAVKYYIKYQVMLLDDTFVIIHNLLLSITLS